MYCLHFTEKETERCLEEFGGGCGGREKGKGGGNRLGVGWRRQRLRWLERVDFLVYLNYRLQRKYSLMSDLLIGHRLQRAGWVCVGMGRRLTKE